MIFNYKTSELSKETSILVNLILIQLFTGIYKFTIDCCVPKTYIGNMILESTEINYNNFRVTTHL